ncbi:MAG: SDR family oxidoreductase [Thermoanaerobaculia bacterium]|nr:SDR family oxidoreductase [Thermoanaerobaculia bacterium]
MSGARRDRGERGRLDGRVALVTGASTGLGYAAAEALASRGATIALNSRGGDKLERAVERLRQAGATVEAFPADLSEREEIDQLTASAASRLGPIEILVANGGGPPVKSASALDEEDWEIAIPRTLLFVPRLVRGVLPGMRRRGWGRIVAINSVSSRQPIAGLALSNALRPAVLGYLKTLSQEVAADGVTVNAVLPGYTRTERQVELAEGRAAQTGQSADEILARTGQDAPMKRMGEPQEIGAMIGFLASPEASYVTGQGVTVDGGYVKGLL